MILNNTTRELLHILQPINGMSLAFQTRLETHKYHGSKHVFTGFTQRASEGGNCPREISPANNRSGRERKREGRSKEEKDGNEVG